jgi:hypothetical protein
MDECLTRVWLNPRSRRARRGASNALRAVVGGFTCGAARSAVTSAVVIPRPPSTRAITSSRAATLWFRASSPVRTGSTTIAPSSSPKGRHWLRRRIIRSINRRPAHGAACRPIGRVACTNVKERLSLAPAAGSAERPRHRGRRFRRSRSRWAVRWRPYAAVRRPAGRRQPDPSRLATDPTQHLSRRSFARFHCAVQKADVVDRRVLSGE